MTLSLLILLSMSASAVAGENKKTFEYSPNKPELNTKQVKTLVGYTVAGSSAGFGALYGSSGSEAKAVFKKRQAELQIALDAKNLKIKALKDEFKIIDGDRTAQSFIREELIPLNSAKTKLEAELKTVKRSVREHLGQEVRGYGISLLGLTDIAGKVFYATEGKDVGMFAIDDLAVVSAEKINDAIQAKLKARQEATVNLAQETQVSPVTK